MLTICKLLEMWLRIGDSRGLYRDFFERSLCDGN